MPVVPHRRQDLDDEIGDRARHRQEDQGGDPDRASAVPDNVDDATDLKRDDEDEEQHGRSVPP
jgi:hypothetical protein